jgi:type IV pilus assembly protein PilW
MLMTPMPMVRAEHLAGRRQRGVSLIEVMVGLALGAIVSAGLLMLFANASSNGQNVQRSSVQIENGRYTAELLRDDFQLAGFFGELATDGAAYTTPDPCATAPGTVFVAAPLSLPTPVRGYSATEALGCLTSQSRLAGTDAIVVRRLELTTVNPAAIASGNHQYHLQTSFCATDPPTTPLVYGKNASAFTLRGRACDSTVVNIARAYVSRIYFVASCNVCGGSGDGIPTLKRLDLIGNELVETALVEGIQNFRLEYGFDTDGNGSADTYATGAAPSGAASLWENVVAVKLHYIVRSTDVVSGTSLAGTQSFDLGGAGTVNTANDGFVRRAYSTTIRLVNPSGARELQ